MPSYYTHHITNYPRSPDHTEVTAQVLDYSFCVTHFDLSTWAVAVDAVQVTLGALMCLLVVIQFIKESLRMYKGTKRFEFNRYMNLLVREGIFYFLAYVHLLSLLQFPLLFY